MDLKGSLVVLGNSRDLFLTFPVFTMSSVTDHNSTRYDSPHPPCINLSFDERSMP